MATKRLLGILKDANGIPLANTTIRFSSTSTRSVLNTVNTDYLTNSEGAYDFSVEYGVYTIQIKREDEINFRTVCANAYVYSEMPETLELLIKAQKHVQEIDETIIQEMLTILASANAAALSASDSADIASTKAAESSASASAAKTSADSSAASAGTSESHSIVSGQKALEAKNSADASAASAASSSAFADNSENSALNAIVARNAAEDQANLATAKAAAASLSEQNALASKQSAENSASIATTKAAESVAARDSATASAAAANSYKDAAEAASSSANLSASTATTKAAEASNYAASAELSKNTATTKAAEASASSATAQGYKDTAVLKASEAAQSAVEAAQSAALAAGALIEAGSADLSSGVFPTPIKDAQGNNRSCFWKVIVGGSVSGDVYGIGDSLVYSKEMAGYYKIDNTEAVSSVNDKQGVVVLNKADIGLANVDNTSDLNKPVSTATKSSLDLKVDKTRTVNSKPLSANIVLTASDVGAAPTSHVGSGGTSHATATASVDGFMSKADKSKLDAIAVSANNYVHPASGVSPGTYKAVTVDGNGHVTGGTNPSTVDGYGITDAAKTHSRVNFGESATPISTADFITQLTNLGAFNSMYWCTKANWTYAYNNYITDTGVGIIQLAGCTIEVLGGSASTYTIRIHTAPTVSISGAVPNADFVYVNHGEAYGPKWHKIYNTDNKPSPADIGAASSADLSTAIASRVPIAGRNDWANQGVIGCTIGMLAWKNYGNNHTIFDASAGTSPDGTTVDKNNSHFVWGANCPTLMGWNGTNTYGVRVDSARWADGATSAISSDRITGTVTTNGQDLTIHGKRAMVGSGDSNTLILNYGNDWGSTVINGNVFTGPLQSERLLAVKNGSTVYGDSQIEARSTDGSDVRIGFNRAGYSAGAINLDSWGFQFERESGKGSRANVAAANFFADAAQDASGNALTRLDYVNSLVNGRNVHSWKGQKGNANASFGLGSYIWHPSVANSPIGNTYAHGMQFGGTDYVNGQWVSDIAFIHGHGLYHRATVNGGFGNWSKFAFTEEINYSNVPTQYRSTSSWIGLASGVSGADAVVIGTNSGAATIGAHSNGLDAWAPLYINCHPNSGTTAPLVLSDPKVKLPNNNTLYDVWHSGNFNPDSKLSNNGSGGTLYLSNWFRSTGATGWYNETYQGGVYMDEPTTVKIYNGKKFSVENSSSDSVYSTGGASFNDVYTRSDIRLKTNLVKIDSALDKVDKLTGYTFDKKQTLTSTETTREMGIIANDLNEVAPEAIRFTGDEQLMTISPSAVNALLIEAIKELREEIVEIKRSMGQ